MYGTTKARAEELAALLNEQGQATIEGKPVETFEVRAHSWSKAGTPETFGLWPRWRYADRPELGLFGGPFLNIGKPY